MLRKIELEQLLTLYSEPALAEANGSLQGVSALWVDTGDLTTPPTIDLDIAVKPVVPIIAVGPWGPETLFDLHLTDRAALDAINRTLAEQRTACATLIQLLRHNVAVSITDALLAESLSYSTLQQSRGFKAWLATRQPKAQTADNDEVLTSHEDAGTAYLTLNRPMVHNAYNMALKDALATHLQSLWGRQDIHTLTLRGHGPSFCAGGDLDEFGQVTDAGLAHLSRTTRSAGWLLAHISCHTRAEVHGACIGAGIELPAFVEHIQAREDSFFQLPEIAMGLVPGAGGTVSITRRIGRQRTAWLAISNQRIDATTAFNWGLVDSLF